MDTYALLNLALTTPRAQFVAKLPHWFFVYSRSAEFDAVEFETRLLDRSTSRPPPLRPRGTEPPLEAIALVKGPHNPYPDRISVGRARNCDVVLRDPSVSKLHAHLKQSPDEPAALVDVGSHNGTRVNGVRLEPNEPRRVAPGDLVVFGAVAGRIATADALYDLLTRSAAP